MWDPVEAESLDARALQYEEQERKRVSGVCGIPVREKNTAMLGRIRCADKNTHRVPRDAMGAPVARKICRSGKFGRTLGA